MIKLWNRVWKSETRLFWSKYYQFTWTHSSWCLVSLIMESILLSDTTLVKWCIQWLHGLCCMCYRFFSLFRWLILVLMTEWGILPIPQRFSTVIANTWLKSSNSEICTAGPKEAYLHIYWTFVRNQKSENIPALF